MEAQIQRVSQFLGKRPEMLQNNSDTIGVLQMLKGETDEAIEAYLQGDRNEFAHELADVLFFLATVVGVEQIDILKAFAEKAARNEAKYPAEMFDGSIPYDDAAKLCKEVWKEQGGDAVFFDTIEVRGSTDE